MTSSSFHFLLGTMEDYTFPLYLEVRHDHVTCFGQ